MKKLLLKVLASSLILGIGVVSIASCTTDNSDEEATLVSIAVTTPPTKTVYVEGESFDKTGMVVTGTYSDNTTTAISNVRISVTPSGALTVDDTYVTISYASLTTTQAITVTEIVPANLELVSTPVATTYATNGTYDFTGLEVVATLDDETTKTLTSSDYTLTINGTVIYDGGEITFDSGTYTVVVTYKTLTVSFEITLIDGYLIEAENILFTDDTEGLDNYVRIKLSESDEYLTEENEHGTSLIQAVVDETAAYASGGSYLGDIKYGNIIDFYFYSSVVSTAEISIRAASGYMTKSNEWSPIVMSDAQLNQLMDVEINGQAITISDDIILEGGSTDDPDGDSSLWVNWKEVTFGTMSTIEGWNMVRIIVTSTLINSMDDLCAFNLDYLAVDFKD